MNLEPWTLIALLYNMAVLAYQQAPAGRVWPRLEEPKRNWYYNAEGNWPRRNLRSWGFFAYPQWHNSSLRFQLNQLHFQFNGLFSAVLSALRSFQLQEIFKKRIKRQ